MALQWVDQTQIRSQVALELLLIQAQAVQPPTASMMMIDRSAPFAPKPMNAYAMRHPQQQVQRTSVVAV